MNIRSRHKMQSVILAANLLFSFAGAITLYTNSSFIEASLGIQMIAIIYAISALASIIILSQAGKILASLGNRAFFLLYGTFAALALIFLIIPSTLPTLVTALIVYLITTNVLIFSMNIFFQHLAPARGRGNARGLFLLLGNIGIMLGPLFSAYAINFAGYTGMYMLALVLLVFLMLVLHFNLRTYEDANYNFGNLKTALVHTLQTRTLRNVISANFILQFFYAWMILYTPIYLYKFLGFSWDTIGFIFLVILSTFVILDYPLGRLADWLGSEKELSAIGFLVMTTSVFMIAIIPHPSVLMVGTLLFFSRVGAATVEAMTEIHFFKIAKDSDPGLLSLFCDLRPLAYLIAPLLGALAIILLPFNMIFVVLAFILMIGFVVSFYLEDTTGWWTRAHKK